MCALARGNAPVSRAGKLTVAIARIEKNFARARATKRKGLLSHTALQKKGLSIRAGAGAREPAEQLGSGRCGGGKSLRQIALPRSYRPATRGESLHFALGPHIHGTHTPTDRAREQSPGFAHAPAAPRVSVSATASACVWMPTSTQYTSSFALLSGLAQCSCFLSGSRCNPARYTYMHRLRCRLMVRPRSSTRRGRRRKRDRELASSLRPRARGPLAAASSRLARFLHRAGKSNVAASIDLLGGLLLCIFHLFWPELVEPVLRIRCLLWQGIRAFLFVISVQENKV